MPWETQGKIACNDLESSPRSPKPIGSRGRDWKSQMLAGVADNLMHSARSIKMI